MLAGIEESRVNGRMKKSVGRWPKRGTFKEWLQRRDRVTYDRYTAQRVGVKRAVQVGKRMADRQWGQRLGNNLEGDKKIFWKEVKRVRKGEQARDEMVKDGHMVMVKYLYPNGQIFIP